MTDQMHSPAVVVEAPTAASAAIAADSGNNEKTAASSIRFRRALSICFQRRDVNR